MEHPLPFLGQMSSSKNQAGDEAVTDRRSSNENYRKLFSMVTGSPWHRLVAPPASNFYHAFHLNRFRHSCWSRGTCPSSAHYKASNQTVAWGLFWITVVKNLTLCRNSRPIIRVVGLQFHGNSDRFFIPQASRAVRSISAHLGRFQDRQEVKNNYCITFLTF